MTGDHISVAFARGLGSALFPLRGKIPTADGWKERPPATEEEVREWVDIGYNLGLATGRKSGVFVIDDDQPKHGAEGWTAPPTGFRVESPTGSVHYYYRWPGKRWPVGDGPRCSQSELAPYVDVRGEGGYVVFAGSVHPDARRPYRLAAGGEFGECDPSVFAAVLKARTATTATPTAATAPPATVAVDMTKPAPASPDRYAEAALLREVHRIRTAGPGERNGALNRAAFSLGQLVAGGVLDEVAVRDQLTQAAKLVGDGESGEDRHIASTLNSGLRAGMQQPRGVPERATATANGRHAPSASLPPNATGSPVLVPGSHVVPGGEYVEQGTHAFAEAVLGALPPGTLYRRAEVVGEIVLGGADAGARFRPVTADRLRTIVDAFVPLAAGKASKEDDEPTLVFRTCSRDNAGILLAYAETHGTIRNLRHLASHPVCVGADLTPAKPGWNEDSGVYLAVDHVPAPLPLPEARAVLDDLVCDFPFASDADRENYYGLILTPILRPGIPEPVPMHLIGSPVERCGKTKLAETVLGGVVLGRNTPAFQLGNDETERDKRILSLLLSGETVVHLDNIREFVDSPVLASLLTSSVYQSRLMGVSRLVSCPNNLSVVASGNNVHATGEIAKRCVPVILQPRTDSPETRENYSHPNLAAHVSEQRERAIGALLGLVEVWREAGRPLGSVGFGGFERWASVLGGIMQAAGYQGWLTNLREWRGGTDDFGSDLVAFVDAWHERFACEWVPTADLFELAEGDGLFSGLISSNSDRGRRTNFGQRVVSRAANRIVRDFKIEVTGQGKRRRGRLAHVE